MDLVWLTTVRKLFTSEVVQKCQYFQLTVFRKKTRKATQIHFLN